MNNELKIIRNMLCKSINAENFINDCINENGFELISNNSDGVMLESDLGRIILLVLPSKHRTNIYTLTYFDKNTNESTCIVDDLCIVELKNDSNELTGFIEPTNEPFLKSLKIYLLKLPKTPKSQIPTSKLIQFLLRKGSISIKFGSVDDAIKSFLESLPEEDRENFRDTSNRDWDEIIRDNMYNNYTSFKSTNPKCLKWSINSWSTQGFTGNWYKNYSYFVVYRVKNDSFAYGLYQTREND